MSPGQTGHITGQMGRVPGTDGTHTRGCPAKILYVYWFFSFPLNSSYHHNDLSRMAQEPNWNQKPEPSEPFFPETGSGTGTTGTVFQEPKPESEPSFSVKTVLKHAQNPFQRRTVGTDNRNCSNRPVQEP